MSRKFLHFSLETSNFANLEIFFCVLLRYRELVGEASTGGSRLRGAWRCGSAAAAPDRRRPTSRSRTKNGASRTTKNERCFMLTVNRNLQYNNNNKKTSAEQFNAQHLF